LRLSGRGRRETPTTNTLAPSERCGQRAQAKHGAARRRQVLRRQNAQQTIPRANENSRGAATPDDNGEQPLATDDDNDDNNDDNNGKRGVKKRLLRQKCRKLRSNVIAHPVGRKTPPPLHQQKKLSMKLPLHIFARKTTMSSKNITSAGVHTHHHHPLPITITITTFDKRKTITTPPSNKKYK